MTVAGILVGSLILLAAGLVIYNILKISVSKRIKGYGTLRAIGSEKGQLYQIIVIEVTLLCLIGIPIGMLLGLSLIHISKWSWSSGAGQHLHGCDQRAVSGSNAHDRLL